MKQQKPDPDMMVAYLISLAMKTYDEEKEADRRQIVESTIEALLWDLTLGALTARYNEIKAKQDKKAAQ